MPDSLPPETLAWLRQSAALDGAVVSQTLLHLLERVETLEQRPIPGFVDLASPTPEAAPVDDEPQTLHTIALRMVDTLERLGVMPEIRNTLRRAIREPMEQPTPEAAPEATDAELRQIWQGAGHVEDALRACYELGRQHGAAQPPAAQPPAAPPAPPAAPAGGLVQRLACELAKEMSERRVGPGTECTPIALAAIREVAAWMRDHEHAFNAAYWLELEADRA